MLNESPEQLDADPEQVQRGATSIRISRGSTAVANGRAEFASFRVYVTRWLHKPASVHHTIGTVSNSLTFRCPGIVPGWPSSNKQVLKTHRNN